MKIVFYEDKKEVPQGHLFDKIKFLKPLLLAAKQDVVNEGYITSSDRAITVLVTIHN